jgi:hypothetical protein
MVFAFNCSGGDADAGGVEGAAEEMKQAGEDLAGAVEDVVEDASEGAADAMSSTIDEIKEAIAEKEGALEAVKAKLADLEPAELTGEAASKLKAESEGLMAELAELKGKLESAMESH